MSVYTKLARVARIFYLPLKHIFPWWQIFHRKQEISDPRKIEKYINSRYYSPLNSEEKNNDNFLFSLFLVHLPFFPARNAFSAKHKHFMCNEVHQRFMKIHCLLATCNNSPEEIEKWTHSTHAQTNIINTFGIMEIKLNCWCFFFCFALLAVFSVFCC